MASISADDLATLTENKRASIDLRVRLGDLEYQRRQIVAEQDALMSRFSVVERDYTHHFNRIRTKYGLETDARINEITGEIE